MLPVKKIYVDSKYKTPDSKSTSDFRFELKESVFYQQIQLLILITFA